MFQCVGTRAGSRGYTMMDAANVITTSRAGYHLRMALSSGFGARRHPIQDVVDQILEHRRVELVDDLLSLPLGQHESGVAELGEVSRYGRPRGRESRGDLARRARPVAQEAQDL